MHGAGQRIEPRVMLPRRFRKFGWVGREFVPETVEIDAFATFDESLHVRAAKAEMPEERIFQYLFPRSYAWHRRIDRHEAPHLLRMECCKRETDHVPDIMRDQIDAAHFECVEHSRDVAG